MSGLTTKCQLICPGHLPGIATKSRGTFMSYGNPIILFTLSTPSYTKRRTTGIDGHRPGTAWPFPLWRLRSRPVYDAHQSKIFESGISIMPPGPNICTLNIQPLGQFRPHLGFSVSPIHIVQRCGQFATYRPVSCRSALMICRCITACSCGP